MEVTNVQPLVQREQLKFLLRCNVLDILQATIEIFVLYVGQSYT